MPQRFADGQIGPVQIDRHDFAPEIEAGIADILPLCNSGICDANINASKVICNGLHARDHRGFIGHIHLDGIASKRVGGLFQHVQTPPGDGHIATFRSQFARDGQTDPCAAARDDGIFSCE